jgi:hypothetical protein
MQSKAGSGLLRRWVKMKKGEDLNLQDESVWRARTLKASYALRALLTELGAWLAALIIASGWTLDGPDIILFWQSRP